MGAAAVRSAQARAAPAPDASIGAISTRGGAAAAPHRPRRPSFRNGPDSTIAGGIAEANYRHDCDLYFQRKSQIFELDPASGAAYVVDAANPAAMHLRERKTF